jgi:hypothetical protein
MISWKSFSAFASKLLFTAPTSDHYQLSLHAVAQCVCG